MYVFHLLFLYAIKVLERSFSYDFTNQNTQIELDTSKTPEQYLLKTEEKKSILCLMKTYQDIICFYQEIRICKTRLS